MYLREIINLENKHIILKNVNGDSLGILHPTDIKFSPRFTQISTLEFTIHKDICPYYNQITSYRRIEIDGLMKFIIEKPQTINDGITESKRIICRSYEIDINRKTIPLLQGTYKFYSPIQTDETICSIILSYLPNWTIESVSSSLWNVYRTFDLSNVQLYNGMQNEISLAYECVFLYDTINQKIKIVAYEDIPKKTDIYLSYNNLVNELQLTEKTEDIFTAIQVSGANELSINRVNILGSTIYNFNHFLNEDGFMSDTLKTRIIEWQNEISIQQQIYADLLTQRANKLSELITFQTELTDLQGQLKSLETTRDALLDSGLSAVDKNTEVKAKKVEISNKETTINNKQIEIDNIDTQLQTIQNTVSLSCFFTAEEFLEIEPFVIQTSITDDNFVIVKTDTELDKQNTAQALYDKYKNLLEDASKLKYEFAVDLLNFISLEEYQTFTNQAQFGSQVTMEVNNEKDLAYPMLLGLDIDWNDNIDIQYLFSTEVKLSEPMIDYDDFSNEVSNMSNKIAGDSIKWSQYVNSGDRDRIFDLFSKGLQADLTEIKNASNQNLVINELGLLARKQIEENVYEDEQLKIMNNRLAITRDGWNSLATVVGKVHLPDGSIGFGVNAGDGILMGNLVASNQLIIKNANNTFTVDADSARLVNATLSVEKGLNKILLDPTNGFKIQNYVNSEWTDVVYLGIDGNLKVKGDIYGGSININNKFLVDVLGNMEATSGKFTGEISASNFKNGSIIGSSINVGDGNFVVDGVGNVTSNGDFNLLGNIRMGGNITWDTPIIQYQYSINNVSWHNTMTSSDKYRRESWDGGTTWQAGYQFVGTDGINGINGSDANVNDINVFNALTNGGKFQGIFSDGSGKLYMNAQYIRSGTLSGVTINVDTNATVGKDLYMGTTDDYTSKRIIFNNGARISGGGGTIGAQIYISANDIYLSGQIRGVLNLSSVDSINWGNNAPVAKFA